MGIAQPYELGAVPGGRFVMGSDRHYPEERPAHPAIVDPFEIGVTTVTNRQFAEFVADTGYRTTAEIPLESNGDEGLPLEYFAPGSLVFQMTQGQVNLQDFRNWWHFLPGAFWRMPEGPGSSIDDRQDHPVVHVSLFDALAYTDWADLSFPSEAEWEHAARDGVETEYPWGDERTPGGVAHANIWYGEFPWRNDRTDHVSFSMAVRAFRPSRYGLFNMIGNVWEWTKDKFRASHLDSGKCCTHGSLQSGENYVVKGGSFLCSPSYCRRYRASARSPQEARSSTSHLGFRCVKRRAD